jgi:hypothetical protein
MSGQFIFLTDLKKVGQQLQTPFDLSEAFRFGNNWNIGLILVCLFIHFLSRVLPEIVPEAQSDAAKEAGEKGGCPCCQAAATETP